MTSEDSTVRNPHRKMKFDPYTGEPIAGHGKHAVQPIIEENQSVDATSENTSANEQDFDKEYSRTAADDVLDTLGDGWRKAKRAVSNTFKRARRGYDDHDIYDMGFSTISLLIEILPKTYEYRSEPKLHEAVSVFKDYLSWRGRGLWKVGRSIGYDTVDSIDQTIQKEFMRSWDNVWTAMAKSPAYNVTSTKSKVEGDYRMGKGVRFAWQRMTLGYDEWQIENASYSIPNRLSVLLIEYVKDMRGYPQDYPEKSMLQMESENWDKQTWFSEFLDNATDDALETNAEMGLSYVAWAKDCLVSAQAMEIAAAMKNSESPVSRAMSGYGSGKQRKAVQDRCREAWYWIGLHIADLWD